MINNQVFNTKTFRKECRTWDIQCRKLGVSRYSLEIL